MKYELTIDGMSCNHCKARVETALNAVAGVTSAKVDLKKKTATIKTTAAVGEDTLRAAVSDAGYEPIGFKSL